MTLQEIKTNYSPQRVVPYCQRYGTQRIMSSTDAVTVEALNKEYGNGTAEGILISHLSALCSYLGLGVRPTNEQLTECAQLMVSHAKWMTMPQLMLFFYKMRTGDIAELHPQCRMQVSFSPTAMLAALRVFASQVNISKNQNTTQDEVDLDNICNFQQFLWLRRQAKSGDKAAQQLLLPPNKRDAEYRELTFQGYMQQLDEEQKAS